MTHVQVFSSASARLFDDLIERTHRSQRQAIIAKQGWWAFSLPGERGTGRHDDGSATYVVAIDGDKVAGGRRLRAATRPYRMSEEFSGLVQRHMPEGRDLVEVTRYFVAREPRFRRTDCAMLAAIMAYCLDEGIGAMASVVETWWLPRWQQAGFVTRPLGLPTEIEGQDCLAVEILVCEETLARVSRDACNATDDGAGGPPIRPS